MVNLKYLLAGYRDFERVAEKKLLIGRLDISVGQFSQNRRWF
jgi:hypothetical protein